MQINGRPRVRPHRFQVSVLSVQLAAKPAGYQTQHKITFSHATASALICRTLKLFSKYHQQFGPTNNFGGYLSLNNLQYNYLNLFIKYFMKR